MKTKKYSRAAKSVIQKKPMKSMWYMKAKCMAKKRCKMVIRISKSKQSIKLKERDGWLRNKEEVMSWMIMSAKPAACWGKMTWWAGGQR